MGRLSIGNPLLVGHEACSVQLNAVEALELSGGWGPVELVELEKGGRPSGVRLLVMRWGGGVEGRGA